MTTTCQRKSAALGLMLAAVLVSVLLPGRAAALVTLTAPVGYSTTTAPNPTVGTVYFLDRTYTITALPAELTNTSLFTYTEILTRNGDRTSTADSFLSFTLSTAATVYIGYDRRATTLPTWLAGFTDTGSTLSVTDATMGHFKVYRKDYAAGTVTLGGNKNGGGDGANSMYIVIVAESTTPAPLAVSPAGVTTGNAQTATVTVSGGVAPYTVTTGSAATATATVAGNTVTITGGAAAGTTTTTITVTDSQATPASIGIAVTNNNNLTVTPATLAIASCSSATVTVTGGTSPYLSPVSTNAAAATGLLAGNRVTVAGISGGTATITVTDSAAATADITVTVNGTLGVTPTAMNLPSGALGTAVITGGAGCAYTATSSDTSVATVVLSDQASAVEGSPTDGINETVNVNAVGDGTATITISDGTSSVFIVVTVTTALGVSPVGLDLAIAQQDTVTITGGTAPYTVVSGNDLVATAAIAGSGNQVTITGVSAGTIGVNITDSVGSVVTVVVNVGGAIAAGLGTCPNAPFVSDVQPNILLILDHSGSMGSGVGSNWDKALQTLIAIINDFPEVRFGLMRMDGSNYAGDDRWYTSAKVVRNGGRVLKPVGTPNGEINAYLANWGPVANVPQTWTTLAETLADAGRYYATVVESGVRTGKGPTGLGHYEKNYHFTIGSTIHDATITDDSGNIINTTSPIQFYCQKSFVIFITDGLSNYDNDWSVVTDVIGNYDGEAEARDCKVGTAGCPTDGRTNYLDDVAKYLFDHDLRSDLTGTQNLTTYMIGYTFSDDLLERAATKGGGQYYSANDQAALSNALKLVIRDILDKTAAGTAVSTISTSAQAEDLLIRAKFLTKSWRGFLESYVLPYHPSAIPKWEAGAILNTNNARHIYTHMSSQTTKKQEFTADNTALVNELAGLWAETTTETADIVNYLRGVATEEGNKYRNRGGWRLGDIIYSTPISVGSPKFYYTDSDYQSFKETNADRPTVIYVGANDGMLHAFRAKDVVTSPVLDCTTGGLNYGDSQCGGAELWAFIPENIHGKVKNLTEEGCHDYYVDLGPVVNDIHDGTQWKTVLVGGTRLGSDEFFCLDVTGTTHTDMDIIWNTIPFSDCKSTNYAATGKVRANKDNADPPTYDVDKWAVILTSGYHEGAAQGRIAALNFTTGAKETIWNDGTSDVNELTTQARATANPYYTLSSPTALDSDDDGYLDLIYAGDTEGTLWKFYYDNVATHWKKVALFQTGGQPITARPVVAFGKDGRLRIYFGTGKYLVDIDKLDDTRNAFYCLVENKQSTADANNGTYTATTAISKTDDLEDVTAVVTQQTFDQLSSDQKTAIDQKGWYFLLDAPASPSERVTEESLVISGYVFFTSFTPNSDVCGFGGNSRLYAVNFLTGLPALKETETVLEGVAVDDRYTTLGAGLPSKPVFYFDKTTKEAKLFIQTSDATLHEENINLPDRPMSIDSWRIVN